MGYRGRGNSHVYSQIGCHAHNPNISWPEKNPSFVGSIKSPLITWSRTKIVHTWTILVRDYQVLGFFIWSKLQILNLQFGWIQLLNTTLDNHITRREWLALWPLSSMKACKLKNWKSFSCPPHCDRDAISVRTNFPGLADLQPVCPNRVTSDSDLPGFACGGRFCPNFWPSPGQF